MLLITVSCRSLLYNKSAVLRVQVPILLWILLYSWEVGWMNCSRMAKQIRLAMVTS